jgi:hypothetical protein
MSQGECGYRNPKWDPAVESHVSRRTRNMGHPDKIKVNIKGSGRECPLYTRLDGDLMPKNVSALESHVSQRTRNMGHPADR